MTTGRVKKYKDSKGKDKYRYIISADRDAVTGKYKQIWRSGFATKAEAQETLRKHLNELDGAVASDITVAEWLERWLEQDCADMKPTTLKSYTSCVHRHLIPALGKIRMDKLSHTDINRMYDKLEGQLSSVTVHKIHRCLRTALNRAIKHGALKESPMTRVDSPERRSPKRGVLSVNQAMEMLAQLRQGGYVAYYGAYLAIYGGLRLGEVCGLRWSDVHWDSGTIEIRRARQRHNRQDVIIQPKTADSIRDVVFSGAAMEELRRWYDKQHLIARRAQLRWTDELYVVTLEDLMPPDPHAFAKGVKIALMELAFPLVTFHDLRHTHATWLLESGVDLKTVSQRLGHSSITITADIYSHVTKRMQQDAVDKMDSMIRRYRENS